MENKRKIVGYMEGTDSYWLTSLVAHGHDTRPLSNGYDNHGLNVRLLNDSNRVDLVVCWLHKVVSYWGADTNLQDLLNSCYHMEIPVMIILPKDLQEMAKSRYGELTPNITLVDPKDILNEMLKALAD